jgi:hypothetical protein
MSRIALWTTYYDPHDEDRKSEFLRCLTINSENPSINTMYILTEDADLPINNEKVKIIHILERPSYNTFFGNYKLLEPESINILVNTDIVIDYRHTSRLLFIKPNQFIALSRYEFILSTKYIRKMVDILKHPIELFGNHEMLKSQFYYSQDTWAILGYPKVSDVFTEKIGVPCCDGRVAYRFHKLGYEVYNPCLSVFTYHFHKSKDRSHYLPSCEGNVAYIRPTSLGAILEPTVSQVDIFFRDDEPQVLEEPILIQRKKPLLSFLRI